MRERRNHERRRVHGGHAEITNVAGPGNQTCPRGQVRVLDWSRSGLLLRIPSPTRKMLLFKQGPCLSADDSIYCTLRFPPHYKSMEVQVDVIRVDRDPEHQDQLQVGVRFDEDVPPPLLEVMANLFEPKQRSKYSGRLSKASKTSQARKTSTSRLSAQALRRSKTGTSKRVRVSGETQRIKSHGGGLVERVKSTRVEVRVSAAARETLQTADESVRVAKESLRLAIESLQLARDGRQEAREQVVRESQRISRASQRQGVSSREAARESQRLAKASRSAARKSQRLTAQSQRLKRR